MASPALNVEAPPANQITVETSSPSPVARFTLVRSARSAALLFLLTLAAIGISGYHPYADDAGIYVAGIKLALNPSLYASSAAFVAAYSNVSHFSVWSAWVARSLHLSIDQYLLSAQIATTWLLLFACLELARRCFTKIEAVWASVALTAVCLSVPVAGSSLSMMDPYLTGRSFSTPLTLLAMVALLDGRILRCALLAILIGLFHPLMFVYASGFLLMLWAVQKRSWVGVAGLTVAAFAAAEAIQYSQRATVESLAYGAAVYSRNYYFLGRWQWYELFGLAAPLLLLALYAWLNRRSPKSGVLLARVCVLIGLTSIMVSLFFARQSSHSHLIAALQTIRPFLLIYYVMFLLLGGILGEYLLKRSPWRWAALLIGPLVGLCAAQHQAYPSSPHLEFPWIANQNSWYRAFVWIRANTAQNSVVAMDSDYIHVPGEDSQGFRAIAERDALADFTKDGGAAAAFPRLAQRWMTEHIEQTGLSDIDDNERLRRLSPFHVTWIVIERQALTALPCPYQNDVVKVCRLR